MMAKLIADTGLAARGKALVATHIDSWENGSQNWTATDARGVPAAPRLRPAAVPAGDDRPRRRTAWRSRSGSCGTCGGRSPNWWSRTTPGTSASWPTQHGMRFTIEAYGGPCDCIALRAARPTSRWASSGRPAAARSRPAEAWPRRRTSTASRSSAPRRSPSADQERWREHPATLKALGDRAFCEGINRFVFHRYALQPWLDTQPGMTMGPWGQHYERTQTWWEQSRAWHEYLARCQYLLRQGLFVADICYLQPEAPPQGFGRPSARRLRLGRMHRRRRAHADDGQRRPASCCPTA